jgi:hypothetical protein
MILRATKPAYMCIIRGADVLWLQEVTENLKPQFDWKAHQRRCLNGWTLVFLGQCHGKQVLKARVTHSLDTTSLSRLWHDENRTFLVPDQGLPFVESLLSPTRLWC